MLSRSLLGTTSNPPGRILLPGAKGTLLIVDDEEGPRKALRIVFKDDYQVLLAEDAKAALELVRMHPVDVAVVDILMPVKSGIELLGEIKEIDDSIQVLILTAFETLETARQALRLGACDYLTKPFDLSTVRTAVASAMKRFYFAQEIRLNQSKLGALESELRQQKMQEEIARSRGEIYASVIHDLNGPLTIISCLMGLTNQEMAKATVLQGESLESFKENLSRISQQVDNCIALSQRYLSFLRNRSSEKTWVSANQILLDMENLLQLQRVTGDHYLNVCPLAEDVMVEMNGADLLQTLLNLATNALQCTDQPHKVEIYGERLAHSLDLNAYAERDNCRLINRAGFANKPPLAALSVKDDGPGIAPENVQRIFHPFFSTKPADQGTGLGLTIVQRFIKEANGALLMTTEAGRGTTFTVFLPAK